MKTIWKYVIGTANYGDGVTKIEVPFGSKFLSIGKQGEHLCAWYEVDPKDTDKKETIIWYQIGTGHPYTDELSSHYIGTIVNEEVGLVWHMFSKVLS